MNQKFAIFVIAICLLITGCPLPYPFYEEPEYSELREDLQRDSEVTLVYVKESKTDSALKHPTAYVFLDRKHIVRLENKQYTKIKVSSGTHEIQLQWFELGGRAPVIDFISGGWINPIGPEEKTSYINFTTNPDKEQFVIIRCKRSNEGTCFLDMYDTETWSNAKQYLENYTFVTPGKSTKDQ